MSSALFTIHYNMFTSTKVKVLHNTLYNAHKEYEKYIKELGTECENLSNYHAALLKKYDNLLQKHEICENEYRELSDTHKKTLQIVKSQRHQLAKLKSKDCTYPQTKVLKRSRNTCDTYNPSDVYICDRGKVSKHYSSPHSEGNKKKDGIRIPPPFAISNPTLFPFPSTSPFPSSSPFTVPVKLERCAHTNEIVKPLITSISTFSSKPKKIIRKTIVTPNSFAQSHNLVCNSCMRNPCTCDDGFDHWSSYGR